jgi:peptidoglycan hydrolase-like protein with peptidoglycan-binding domain
LIGRLENCVFETRIDGRKVRARLTSDYIAGFRDSRDSKFSGFDWAVIRLKSELPVEPYQVNDELTSLFSWLDVANVTKVANFNFENWGAKRTRTKSLADCVIRPEIVAWSSGVRGLRTDCDISPGNSGGAVLSEVSGTPRLVGIIVGTTATSFKTRKPFDLYNNYNIGALVEGEFLQAIRDMASKMSVRDVQAALSELGYDPGPADNVAGRRTIDAIRKFQTDNGLAETGRISGDLSLALARALSAGKQPGKAAGAKSEFDAASDAFVSDLYRWRVSKIANAGAARSSVQPGWMRADLGTEDVVGPLSAWASAKLRGCRNILACLEAYGAPAQALRAAYALEKTGLIGTYVSSFIEYGKVDLVSVGFPYNTGGTVEYALVNGKPSAMSMRSGDVLDARIDDRRYQQFRRENSNATIRLTPRLESHRLLSGGGQRFVFAFPVTNGCLTCNASGQILIAYDFGPDGQFDRLRPLAYAETDEQLDRQVRRKFLAEDLAGDPALVQRRLNGLGYDAGPIDGVPGRKTETAIAGFQSDHGLLPTGRAEGLTVELLASDGARREIRRFEMLLQHGAAAGFGRGLLSRIGQLSDSTTLHRATLANNLAGESRLEGNLDDAEKFLAKAEIAASRVRSRHPVLYAAILLNRSENQIAMQDNELAGKTLGRAAEFLRGSYPRGKSIVAPDAITQLSRPDVALSAMRDFLVRVGSETEIRVHPSAAGKKAFLQTLLFAVNGQKS